MTKKTKGGFLGIVMPLILAMAVFVSCGDDSSKPKEVDIKGVAFDAISFSNLTGALVTLEPAQGTKAAASVAGGIQTTVDAKGEYIFKDVKVGSYNLYIEMDGYKSMFSNNVDLSYGEAYVAFLPVTNDITTPVGGITGVVLDKDGKIVPNANIAISAQNEAITNGYFSSATTNQYGQFFIGAVPLQSTQEFKVRCMASGFDTQVIQNINMLQNEMVVVYFQLNKATPATVIFSEGFESSTADWNMTGFWHVQQNADIYNQAYPDYVNLAPNDASEGRIPNAFEGTRMAWYGEAETGNFMGTQSPGDSPGSGGTSMNYNYGSMISPEIDLSGQNVASVNFWSWFEIESVNPNQYGYDLMEIYVLDSDGNELLLGKLNPYTDPLLPDRKTIPFTSGGFNQAPVWKYEEFDLSAFVGTTIRLEFRFDTRDHLYNGFRGWFVDEIKVVDKAASEETKSSFDITRPLMQRGEN